MNRLLYIYVLSPKRSTGLLIALGAVGILKGVSSLSSYSRSARLQVLCSDFLYLLVVKISHNKAETEQRRYILSNSMSGN